MYLRDRLPTRHARRKWADLRPSRQAITDVCLLFLLPDLDPGEPFHACDALIVGAHSLHHPQVPRPDGRRMHDVLTRHPHRHHGGLVFLSDLTADLDRAGLDWGELHCDWEEVTDTLAELAWTGQIRHITLRLPELMYLLAAIGPATTAYLSSADSEASEASPIGRDERRAVKAELASTLARELQELAHQAP